VEGLTRLVYELLPRIKLPDLLLEVDSWTQFLRHFTHLQTGDPAKDQTALLAALLAEALNLGVTKMAEACPGITFTRISWIVDWCMRDETYTKALAEVINYHHRQPFAAYWGDGTTSSSDGQRGTRRRQAGTRSNSQSALWDRAWGQLLHPSFRSIWPLSCQSH